MLKNYLGETKGKGVNIDFIDGNESEAASVCLSPKSRSEAAMVKGFASLVRTLNELRSWIGGAGMACW